MNIKPFKIKIPQSQVDDLQTRLAMTRFTDEIPGSGSDYGVRLEWVKRMVEYWRSGYDWRTWESTLNAHPQFTTEIDGQDIHFLHVRSAKENALALILTHGWPGTVVEYLDVIDDLSQDFHLVIPSLPGFGFSGPTRERGWNRYRTARAWAALMERLGYDRYGAVGNDAGSFVSPELGRVDPEHVIGVHVTQIFSFPTGNPAEFEDLTEEEQAALQHLQVPLTSCRPSPHKLLPMPSLTHQPGCWPGWASSSLSTMTSRLRIS
jgi:pimeloyl-ACP methyl ester carboxylesterase